MNRTYLHLRSAGYVAYLLAEAAWEELSRWRIVRRCK